MKPIITDANILFKAFEIRPDFPNPETYKGHCLIVPKPNRVKSISFVDSEFKPTDFDEIREEYRKAKIVLLGKELFCWERVR